jgi:hypothetical protein
MAQLTDRSAANATMLAQIESEFTYHAPVLDQPVRYARIRDAAKAFATLLVEDVPPCADRTAALRKLREVVWTANAAIAIQESGVDGSRSR